MPNVIAIGTGAAAKIDVTIVMPCLNEAKWLPACIANAKAALTRIRAELGLNGEILIADNGSTDGSQLIARALGAMLIEVSQPGYGAALASGMKSASGTFLVMGDADGSYDFRECVEMIRTLMNGADLCMGSRFKGAIKTNAMPWKNQFIGNPLLTGALNLIFGAGVSDAQHGIWLSAGFDDRVSSDAGHRLRPSHNIDLRSKADGKGLSPLQSGDACELSGVERRPFHALRCPEAANLPRRSSRDLVPVFLELCLDALGHCAIDSCQIHLAA
ncbi:MAG: glycosyltransferase family 2 protein [Methylocella sp.]